MQKRSLKQKCLTWALSLAVAMTFIPLTAGFAFADDAPDMFINLEKANGSDFAGDEVKVYVNLEAPWQDGDALVDTQVATGTAMKPVVSNLNCKWAGTFTEESKDPNGEPYFTVDYGEGDWTAPGDYTLKVIANDNAAPFEAAMKGTNHIVKFKGTYELPCKIINDPKDLAISTVTFSDGTVNTKTGAIEIPYDGQEHKLVPAEVKDADGNVVDPAYYEVTYPNTTTNAYSKVGDFDIVIKAKEGNAGGYKGEITKVVSITDVVSEITVYSQKGLNGKRNQEKVFKSEEWSQYALSNPIKWGYKGNVWDSKNYIPVETLFTEAGLAVGGGKDMIDLWTNSEPEHYFNAPQTVADLQKYKYTADGKDVLGVFGGEFSIPAYLVLDCESASANPRGAVGSETNDSTTPPGNMSPSAVSEISLVSMDVNGLDVSLKKTTYTYTGKALKPAVTVKDGDEAVPVTVVYSNNTKAGKGTVKITAKEDSAYYGTVTKTFKINKAAQKITKVTPATKTFKAKKKTKKLAKKYTFTLKVKGTGTGKATFKKANKAGASKITVAKTGKVTVKKGLKKGTYTVKVKATKAATANYKAASKTVTIKIVVK